MSKIKLLQHIWDILYDPRVDAEKAINEFFHQDYQQCINGVTMNRTEYIQHVLEQRKTITIDMIDYRYFLEKNNEFFAIYYPRGQVAVRQAGDFLLRRACCIAVLNFPLNDNKR